ncbi:MAG: tetraacyldisaccharide 4'-kinase [Flavobacteriales bacterium]|jgi:tetraacyldisaccharide 4'-kinase
MKFLKFLLFPFSLIYLGIVSIRNGLYNKSIFKSSQFDLPIICVGNLSMGGTGKTPHTEYLIRLLQNENQIATLSRGYGRKTTSFQLAEEGTDSNEIGDEPFQYFRKFPKTYVAVEKKRVLGVLFLLNEKQDTDVIILDDAFQHRSLKAGLNILITDFNRPYYSDFILPTGELRESRKGAKRADAIIISKCPYDLSIKSQKEIISKINLEIPVFFTSVEYGDIYDATTNLQIEDDIREYEILLITGIAKPQAIENKLKKDNISYRAKHFGDHHRFTKKDIETISKIFGTFTSPKKIVLTTEKDYSRMAHMDGFKTLPIHCLPIEVKFINDQNEFDNKVLEYVTKNKRDSSLPEGADE